MIGNKRKTGTVQQMYGAFCVQESVGFTCVGFWNVI